MIVVLPLSHRDQDQAERVLSWTLTLDSYLRNHTLVLLGSTLSDKAKQDQLAAQAKSTFGYVASIRQRTPEERPWPISPNAMFRVATNFVAQTYRKPFLWLEPDAIPLKPGWLNTLEMEYSRCGKDFMGAIWGPNANTNRHMNGNGIYPAGFVYDGPDTIPFDVWLGERVINRVYSTPLIHHEWGNIQTNTPWQFPDAESLKRIRKEAVVFHRCKDGALITRLQESKMAQSENALNGDPGIKPFRKFVKGLIRSSSTYYHSGNLGDIIWALYAIKLDGGGDLIIGPEQRGTSPCAVPINQSQFNLFLPLLKKQHYLRSVTFSETYPNSKKVVDLNRFRNNWDDEPLKDHTGITNLCKMHCYTLGVVGLFKEDATWIDCEGTIPTGKIIISRTDHYHSGKKCPVFQWKHLVDRFREDMLFIGRDSEHEVFCNSYGHVSFWKVRDFLDMAQVIAGGRAYVGNQTFQHAIAIAMGKKVISEAWQEYADCFFDRPNYMDQNRHSLPEFEEWLQ